MPNHLDLAWELIFGVSRLIAARLDEQLRVVEASRGFAEAAGVAPDALAGRGLFEFLPDLPADIAGRVKTARALDRQVTAFRAHKETIRLMAVVARTDDGAIFFAERTSAASPGAGEANAGESEELRGRIAYLDALVARVRREQLFTSSTGLYTRAMLDRVVDAEIARSIRTGRPFAVVMAGVDRAQALDQLAGEDARSKVVTVVARAMAAKKRVFDQMGHLSPSELYIIQPENDLGGANEFCERIRKSMDGNIVKIAGRDFPISLSFGCGFFHPTANHYRDRAELLSQVEAALFTAASSGGNRTVRAPGAGALAAELERLRGR
ncbi:diguanylate cyclase [bacterium]|nr:diguanylate cyclase [bacterium]